MRLTQVVLLYIFFFVCILIFKSKKQTIGKSASIYSIFRYFLKEGYFQLDSRQQDWVLHMCQGIQLLTIRVNIYLCIFSLLAAVVGGFILLIKFVIKQVRLHLLARTRFTYLVKNFSRKMHYKGAEYSSCFSFEKDSSSFVDTSETPLYVKSVNRNSDTKTSITMESFVEQEMCLICHHFIQEGQQVIDIPKCGHFMHDHCLLGYLRKQNICPCCRNVVVFPDL